METQILLDNPYLEKFQGDKLNTVTARLKVLSNPDRLKILCVLVNQELHVQQIENFTQIRQPTLSQQLTVLRQANIVVTRREGKQIYYQIQDQNVLKLMQTLDALYCSSQHED
ncbi:winged helix-turn-helix transcriptional regulator [Acinetobacter sp. 194]|uniref:ArsR/SmtB family transcription factor n=1 Tax=Acinetobacter shaoyimingii TaxID=2715164 RepID=UPI0014081314|nr:metalloregulator ArsR/SmtB family transcription factor [Acinetobacter shaoyimingii]NHB58416.1 winged helix-turn-helix transcriptional regulator [Acinetobacter shaoyimingii]